MSWLSQASDLGIQTGMQTVVVRSLEQREPPKRRPARQQLACWLAETSQERQVPCDPVNITLVCWPYGENCLGTRCYLRPACIMHNVAWDIALQGLVCQLSLQCTQHGTRPFKPV